MNDSPKKYSLISLDASAPEINELPRETVNENGVSTTHLVVDGEETVVVSSKPVQAGAEGAHEAVEAAAAAKVAAESAAAANFADTSRQTRQAQQAQQAKPSGESNKAAEMKKRQPSASLQDEDEDEEIPFKRMQTTIIICLVAVMAIFFIYFNFFRH